MIREPGVAGGSFSGIETPMAAFRSTSVTPARKPKFSFARMMLLVFLTLLCAGLLHAGWSWQTDRSLQKRIDALRAAGEKILPTDFRGDYADIDGDQNAERDILAAGAFADDDT